MQRVSEERLTEIIKAVVFAETTLGYPVRTDTEMPPLMAPPVMPILLDLRDCRAEVARLRKVAEAARLHMASGTHYNLLLSTLAALGAQQEKP